MLTMFPHTVTVYVITEDPLTLLPTPDITVLRGVLLDAKKGANVVNSGLEGADAVTLYIPFDVTAVDGLTDLPKTWLPPRAWEQEADRAPYWTLDTGSLDSAVCFFVKGEEVLPNMTFQQINLRRDGVYTVTSVDIKDFGGLQHLEVGGR